MIPFFVEVFLFLLCIVLCFYLPGRVILHKLKLQLPGIANLFIILLTGITTFTLAIYLLSWIRAPWLIMPLLILIVFYIIKKKLWQFSLKKQERIPLLFIMGSAIVFSLAMIPFGMHGDTIVYGYDDVWHLALMQEMKVNFPPGIPFYAGLPLQGYHFFADFLQANISNLFFLSPFNLHFYFFSSLTAILWGIGVYGLMVTWTKKVTVGLWAVFLTMFGGNFAYVFHWQGHTEVSLKEGLRMLQPASILYNPPLAFSIVILLFCLLLLLQYLKTRQKKWLIPFIFAAGILPMFKVYAGIILYGGLGILVIIELFKKNFFLLQIALATAVVSLSTLGVFLGSGGGFIYYPLWAPHELLRNFSWYGYDEKISTYTQQHVTKGIIQTELYGLFLFLIANLGTRILGLFGLLLLIKKAKPSLFALSVFAMLLISILVPLLFIQTGKVFEIIQMANYYLFFAALFAAIGFGAIFNSKHKFLMIIGIIFVVAFTIPSTLHSFEIIKRSVATKEPLSNPYHSSLFFLRGIGSYNDTVLILPEEKNSQNLETLTTWQRQTSSEIPALLNKRVYLAGVGITYNGMDVQSRLKKILMVRNYVVKPSNRGKADVTNFLKENDIKYIYSYYEAKPLLKINGVEETYNDEYYVYQINQN